MSERLEDRTLWESLRDVPANILILVGGIGMVATEKVRNFFGVGGNEGFDEKAVLICDEGTYIEQLSDAFASLASAVYSGAKRGVSGLVGTYAQARREVDEIYRKGSTG